MTFDKKGNLYPYQKTMLTLSNFQDVFVREFSESKTRLPLFLNLCQYRNDLFGELNCFFPQWIGGSFVTQKQHPSDIDIANLIPFDDTLDLTIERIIPYFTIGGSHETYGIDGHLIPIYGDSDIRYENTQLRLAYFMEWFGHDRNDYPKGFIEILEP